MSYAVSTSGKLEQSYPPVISGENFDECRRRGGTPPRELEGRMDKILSDRSQVKTRTSGRTGGEGNVCKIWEDGGLAGKGGYFCCTNSTVSAIGNERVRV